MKKNINTNIDTNANPFLRRNKTQQEGEEGVLPAYRDTQVQNTCGAHGERRERPVEVPPDATSQVLATQFPSERPGLRDEPTTIFNADEKEKLRARDVVMGHVQLGSFPKREKPIVHEEKVAQPVVVKKQVTVHERDFARPVQRAVPLDSSSRHKAEAERDMQETQRDRAEVARVDGGKARERTLQADSRAAYKRLEEVAGMTFGLSEQRSDRPQREREWREDRAQSEPQPERQDSEWWGNAGRKLGEVGMDVGGRTIHATGAVAAGTASLVGGTATQVAAGTANLVGGTASQVAGAAGGVWSGMWQGAQEKLKEAKDYVFAGDKTEPLAFDDQDIVSNERRMRQLSPGSSQDTGEAGDSSISRQGQKQVGFESSQSSDRTGDRPGKYEDVDVGKRLPECGQDVTRSEHFPRQQSTKSSAQVGRRAGDATVSFRERQKQPGLKNFGGLQPPLQWSLGADRHAGEVGDAKESRECQAPVGKAFEGGGNIGPPESSISSDQEAIQSDRSQRQQSLESSLHGVWSPANQGAISPSKHENQFIEDHHPPSSWSQGVGSRSGEFGGRKQLWNEDAEAGKNRGLAERSTSGGQNVTQVERWQSEQSSESPTQDIGHRPGEAMGFSRERQKQPGSKTTEGCQPPSRGIEGRAGNAESRQQSSESSHDVVSRSRDADISSISRERRKQVGFGDVEGYQQSRSSEVGVYSLPRERQKQMGIEDTEG
ncbi:hypothetical protein BDQ17DRAFT_391991 [Cyathus striatus]|nr:hypothetical protein BDQ17DRAFT_391991 [Cyathus striatus]